MIERLRRMIDSVFRAPARREPAELADARERHGEVIAKADRILHIVDVYRKQDDELNRLQRRTR